VVVLARHQALLRRVHRHWAAACAWLLLMVAAPGLHLQEAC
jgi:hypothetical protein